MWLVAIRIAAVVLGFVGVLTAGPTLAATCENGDFAIWLEAFKQEAAAQGISPRTLATLEGITYDTGVVSRDRHQGVFRQSFEQFSGRMVPPRLRRGADKLKQYGPLLARIERQFRVPAPILVAIWGLETDFGADVGNFSTLRSLASLAYDCRRSEKFQAELIDALRIVQHGDMMAAEMRGAWAEEIGQTQFMPSSYVKFAVDYDGNGRRDLIHSVPDALASTANYLRGYGWQAVKPWREGSANFDVLLEWNKAQVYSRTIAYFATQLEEAR